MADTMGGESQHQLYRHNYGVAKTCNPDLEVGVGTSTQRFLRPILLHVHAPRPRGDEPTLDFINAVVSDNCASLRFHTWVENICYSLFADASLAEGYPFLLRPLQLVETPYENLPSTGFSAEYVRREKERPVAAVDGRCHIYPGIDCDIPRSQWRSARRDKSVDALGTSGVSRGISDASGLTQCTRSGVKGEVLAAFTGGAQGAVLSQT